MIPRDLPKPGGTPSAALPSAPRSRSIWLVAAVVAAVSTLPYLRLADAELVGDGRALVIGHETLRTATRDPAVFARLFREDYWDGLAPASGLYRPLTTSLFAVVHGVAGERPAPYRCAAIAAHAICAALAWVFLARLLGGPTLAAGFAALLFALHPVHTEAVGDVANLGEMLAAILSLVLLCRLAGRSELPRAPARVVDGALFFSALLAKESAACLLLVAPLLVASRPRARRDRGVLVALAIAFLANLALRAWALGFLFPRYAPTNRIENPLLFVDPLERAATGLRLIVRGLGLLVFPARLSADYSFDTVRVSPSPFDPAALASIALLIAIIAFALRAWRSRRVLAFGVLATLASFATTSNLVVPAGTIFAERHLLVPSLFLAVTAGAAASRIPGAPIARRVAAASGLVVLSLFAARAFVRAGEWSSPARLTEVTARRDAPRSIRVLYHLAMEQRKAGNEEEARASLRRALEIDPRFFQARAQLGFGLRAAGDLEGAVREWKTALAEGLHEIPGGSPLWNDTADAFRGTLAVRLGRPDEAIRFWEALLESDPESPDLHGALAFVLAEAGRPGVEEHLRRAAVARADPRVLLAQGWAASGRLDEALDLLRSSLPERAGANARAQLAFAEGQVLFQAGRTGEALPAFRRAHRLASLSKVRSAARVGVALAELEQARERGRKDEALRAGRELEAATADPSLPTPMRDEARRLLVDAYRALGDLDGEARVRSAPPDPPSEPER